MLFYLCGIKVNHSVSHAIKNRKDMKQTINLSNLMKSAWMLVKRFGFTIKEAMKQMWAIEKLRKAMRGGIVKFMYRKLDGTIRTAWGTLNDAIVPATQGERKPNETVVTYYDTDRSGWRCFKVANFIEMA